jgi:hypothetical protein
MLRRSLISAIDIPRFGLSASRLTWPLATARLIYLLQPVSQFEASCIRME